MACRRCYQADSGSTDLCARCELLVEQEQNREDALETGRPWADGYCLLARFSPVACGGRMDPAHLIPKSVMRREHVPTEALWDPRCWVPACRDHHAAFDVARTLRVPRPLLPAGLERFAEEMGLEWFLSREYGPKLDESEAA